MTRHHQDALAANTAREYLRAQSNRQLDPRIVLVMPSISAQRFRAACEWFSFFEQHNVRCTVIANAASVAVAAKLAAREAIDLGRNAGFSASINAGLRSSEDWDWAIIANDDILISAESAEAVVRIINATYRKSNRGPTFFDPGPARPLPGLLGVFFSISLLLPIAAPLTSRLRGRPKPAGRSFGNSQSAAVILPLHTFKAFSFVAIDRDSWEALDGLSERFTFYYEDSDFIRRHQSKFGNPLSSFELGLTHNRSASSSAHIQSVLPVAVHSAIEYLNSIGHRRITSRLLVWAALLVRVPLVGFSKAKALPHLRGIAASFKASVKVKSPSLPNYSSL